MKKRIGMFLAAAMAAMCAQADTWTDPDTGYTWTYPYCGNGDTAEIGNGYSCAISPTPTGAVAITSTLGGKTVTSIRDQAFYCCSGLTSVTIPDSVTNIGSSAFSGCSGLKNVTIPQVLCSSKLSDNLPSYRDLTNVVIGAKVTRLADYLFQDCMALKSVYFKGDAPDTGVSIYFGTPRSLVTYVVSGTIGWSGGISEDVPEVRTSWTRRPSTTRPWSSP